MIKIVAHHPGKRHVRARRNQISKAEERLPVLLKPGTLHRSIVPRMSFHPQPWHSFVLSFFQFELPRLFHWPPIIGKVARAGAIARRLGMLEFSLRDEVTRIWKRRRRFA